MAFLKTLLKAVGQLFSPPVSRRKSSQARRKRKRPAAQRPRASIRRRRSVKKKKSPAAAKKQKKRNPPKKKISLRPHPKKKAQAVSRRKGAVKSAASSRPVSVTSNEETPVAKPAGEITHYFSKIGVCVVKVKRPLAVGDKIQIKGHTTDFIQTVESMQVESRDVRMARKGQLVGLKVKDPARPGDEVYLQK